MGISLELIKELRERTSAGINDCKKALAETNGDIDKAADFLREKGLAAAAKKAGRPQPRRCQESPLRAYRCPPGLPENRQCHGKTGLVPQGCRTGAG